MYIVIKMCRLPTLSFGDFYICIKFIFELYPNVLFLCLFDRHTVDRSGGLHGHTQSLDRSLPLAHLTVQPLYGKKLLVISAEKAI